MVTETMGEESAAGADRIIAYAQDLLFAIDDTDPNSLTALEVAQLKGLSAEVQRANTMLLVLADKAAKRLAVSPPHLRLDALPGEEFGQRFAGLHWRFDNVIPEHPYGQFSITIAGDHLLTSGGKELYFPPEDPYTIPRIDMFNVMAAMRGQRVSMGELGSRAVHWGWKQTRYDHEYAQMRTQWENDLAELCGRPVLKVQRFGNKVLYFFDKDLIIDDIRLNPPD